MTNLIKELQTEQLAKASKKIPAFSAGDTVRVMQKIIEDKGRERLQAFEGVVIARHNDGLNSSFVVRKISFGTGAEKVFPLYSPNIAEIIVVRRGKVRRGKIYYLRQLFGKKARITEDKKREASTEASAE